MSLLSQLQFVTIVICHVYILNHLVNIDVVKPLPKTYKVITFINIV